MANCAFYTRGVWLKLLFSVCVYVVAVTSTAAGAQAPTEKETKKPGTDKRLSTWRAAGGWRRWCSAFWNSEPT